MLGTKEKQLEEILQEVLARVDESKQQAASSDSANNQLIPIGVSNRHIHLCQSDLDQLFGVGHELTIQKWLKQPNQFAAKELVTLVGPKGSISTVRVLGPIREQSQVEISKTDSFTLGVKAPIRESGDLKGAGAITVVGPKGMIQLTENVILAKRHIHMHPDDAKRFGVVNHQIVAIKTTGPRATVFYDTVVRVRTDFKLECHVDTDEANAANLGNNSQVELVKNL